MKRVLNVGNLAKFTGNITVGPDVEASSSPPPPTRSQPQRPIIRNVRSNTTKKKSRRRPRSWFRGRTIRKVATRSATSSSSITLPHNDDVKKKKSATATTLRNLDAVMAKVAPVKRHQKQAPSTLQDILSAFRGQAAKTQSILAPMSRAVFRNASEKVNQFHRQQRHRGDNSNSTGPGNIASQINRAVGMGPADAPWWGLPAAILTLWMMFSSLWLSDSQVVPDLTDNTRTFVGRFHSSSMGLLLLVPTFVLPLIYMLYTRAMEVGFQLELMLSSLEVQTYAAIVGAILSIYWIDPITILGAPFMGLMLTLIRRNSSPGTFQLFSSLVIGIGLFAFLTSNRMWLTGVFLSPVVLVLAQEVLTRLATNEWIRELIGAPF